MRSSAVRMDGSHGRVWSRDLHVFEVEGWAKADQEKRRKKQWRLLCNSKKAEQLQVGQLADSCYQLVSELSRGVEIPSSQITTGG